ncbi:MAG: cupin domain-containing protein [Bacteroidetes bacterium]|nr:MAG: cupin domain-containing protein [Bacteroidota bacterium]
MSILSPILSSPEKATRLNLGESHLIHRIRSDQTGGALAVVEFVSGPGEGVGLHIHQNEDELVYLLKGEIEVTLGDQKLGVTEGACALLPRNIPHGYTNVGKDTARLLAVLLPGGLDQFFVQLDHVLATQQDHQEAIGALCRKFGLTLDASQE